jgi:hypothetical protein
MTEVHTTLVWFDQARQAICVHLSCCLYMTMTSFLAVGLFPCNGLAFPAA